MHDRNKFINESAFGQQICAFCKIYKLNNSFAEMYRMLITYPHDSWNPIYESLQKFIKNKIYNIISNKTYLYVFYFPTTRIVKPLFNNTYF